MGIEGNGYRSNLARRMQRLLMLQNNSEWRLPRPTAVIALKVFAPILLVILLIASNAIAQHDRTQPRDLHSAIQGAWKDSVGALALNAVTTTPEPILSESAPLTTNRFSSPVKEPIQLLSTNQPPTDAAPKPAAQAERDASTVTAQTQPLPTSRPPPATDRILSPPSPQTFSIKQPSQTPSGKTNFLRMLQEIQVTHFSTKTAPLEDVVKQLHSMGLERDPTQRGLGFSVIHTDVARVAIPAFDLNNVSLLDVLHKIASVAPVQYSIGDSGLEFQTNHNWVEGLITRTFRVEPNSLIEGLKAFSGLKIELPSCLLRDQSN